MDTTAAFTTCDRSDHDHDSLADARRCAAGGPTAPTGGSGALVGVSSNAFAIMGATDRLLKRAGATDDYRKAVMADATSGDYDHLLVTCMAALDNAPDDDTDDDR